MTTSSATCSCLGASAERSEEAIEEVSGAGLSLCEYSALDLLAEGARETHATTADALRPTEAGSSDCSTGDG